MNATYYHGSNTKYSWPSFEKVDNWTEEDGRAAKVMLGYYVTANQSFAAEVGEHVYVVGMCSDLVVYEMPLAEMKKLYQLFEQLDPDDRVAAYMLYRSMMAEDYDMIHIVEHDGRVGESIIINLKAIDTFEHSSKSCCLV